METKQFDFVFLGSGSTAFAAAIRAAELGKTVAMTENRTLGGTCVNRGCLPSKNLIAAAGIIHEAAHPRYPGIEPARLKVNFADLIRQKDEVIAYYRFLVGQGFKVALLNPLRTRRFAEEELERTKTDSVDALGIARFAAQKHPAPTPVADELTAELRELVRLRTRYVDEHSDRMRQLHRAVDLGFPEFTCHVRMNTVLATAILARYPTARSYSGVSVRKLARLAYDGRHQVGEILARALIETAKISVGSHHSEAYGLQVKYTCSDMELLRNRVKQLDKEIEGQLQTHEVGKLLTTIDGIGSRTAACLIAELGDPSRFRDAAALASYVGVVPRLRQSGKRAFSGARGLPLGNARLRHSAVDADIGRCPEKPVVARALRPPVGCGQATEGRDRGLYAKVARRDLQRRAQPAPFCASLGHGWT